MTPSGKHITYFIIPFSCKLRLEGCSTVFLLPSSTDSTNHFPQSGPLPTRAASPASTNSQARGSWAACELSTQRNSSSEHFPKGAVLGQQCARQHTLKPSRGAAREEVGRFLVLLQRVRLFSALSCNAQLWKKDLLYPLHASGI